MILAIGQNRFRLFLIDQIKGKVGSNVAKGEGHHWAMFQTVVDAFGVRVRNVIRQGDLDDPIRLSPLQLTVFPAASSCWRRT